MYSTAVISLARSIRVQNLGLVSREQLAAAFAETARQQSSQGASETRGTAVEHLAQFFELSLRGDRSGLRVIVGGKDGRDAGGDAPDAA